MSHYLSPMPGLNRLPAEVVRAIDEGLPYQPDELRRALELQRRAEDLLRESRRILERLAPVEMRRTA